MSNFTIIHHEVRLKMGLTCNEYCVGDLIRRLSEGTGDGWCFASRSKIGDMLGLSKPSIITILNTMVSLKLIEVDPVTKHLKVSKLWLGFFVNGKDSLPAIGQDSLPIRIRNYTKKENNIGKDSLHLGQDSLPAIGQDSLPPSYKEILLNKQLQIQSIDVEKIDIQTEEIKPIVDQLKEEKKEPPKVPQKGSDNYNPEKEDLPFKTSDFREAWILWATHRKEIKKKLTESTSKLQLKKLASYSEGLAIAFIQQAVEKGWMGIVYELRREGPYGSPPPTEEKGKIQKSVESISSAADNIRRRRELENYN